MKAIRYFNYGEPSAVLSEVQLTEPSAPAAGQVLVHVTKRPIHPGDLLGIRGRYRAQSDTSPPAKGGVTPGFEGFGTVLAIGSGTSVENGLRIGTRVGFFPAPGAWSEIVLAAGPYVVPIPEDIPDTTASQLFVTPMTAMLLLRAAFDAGLNESGALLVNAANSNVARLVALLAQQRGIQVVGLVRRDAAVQELQRRLPGATVLSTESATWMSQARDAAGGRPFRVALDAVGGPQTVDVFALLADGGTYVSYGNLSGQPTPMNSLILPVRNLVLRGVSVGRWAGLPAEQREQDIRTAFQLMRDTPDHFRVSREFPMAQVGEAVELAESKGRSGTVLLTS